MRREKAALVVAILATILAIITMADLLPRVRLVEVIMLFGTAFGAGAGFTKALNDWRARSRDRVT
jgi:hypothetical protein